MAQAVQRRRQAKQQQSGSNVFGLLVVLALVFGLGYYGWMTLTTGDWMWWSSTFEAQPRTIAVVENGQRTEIDPSDPAFNAIAAAFNQSISAGYRDPMVGFSDPTWEIVEQRSVYVEASYAEPIKLHGEFVPTTQLRLVLDGEKLHQPEALFRFGDDDWDRSPIVLETVEPLATALQQHGFAGTTQ